MQNSENKESTEKGNFSALEVEARRAQEETRRSLQPKSQALKEGEDKAAKEEPKPKVEVVVKEVIKDSSAEVARKEEGRAGRERKEAENAEREAITDLDILKAMRQFYHYHPGQKKYKEGPISYKSSSISKADLIQLIERDEVTAGEPKSLFNKFDLQESVEIDGLLHTLESAKMVLARMEGDYEEADLWLEDDVEVNEIIKLERMPNKKQVIGNLFPIPGEWDLSTNKKTPILLWRSYKYNDGIREYVVPIPPPHTDKHPPLIADEEWGELVSFSRLWCDHQIWTAVPSDIEMYREMDLDRLPFLSAYNAEKRAGVSVDELDVAVELSNRRRMFAVELILMGVLDCDEAYERFSQKNPNNRRRRLLDDPRVYWEKAGLENIFYGVDEKSRLRNKVRRLVWLAYQAGREAELHKVVQDKAKPLLREGKFEAQRVESGEHRKERNASFEDAAKEFLKLNGELPKGAPLRDFIMKSKKSAWVTALDEVDKKSQLNVLNGVLRGLNNKAR